MRDFRINPRTKRESFELIAYALKKGHLTQFSVSQDSKYDPFGACLTAAQRRWVRENGLEGNTPKLFVNEVGEKNIRAMTGMTVGEIQHLVIANDERDVFDDSGKFSKEIRNVIKSGKGSVAGRFYKL